MTRIIEEFDVSAWHREVTCLQCATHYEVDAADVKVDRFKKPSTYFFDGSADAVGLTTHHFVECPNCRYLSFVDDAPFAVKQQVRT